MENVSVGRDSLLYLVAPPQYGKTVSMLFSMWRTGVEHGMPSVMFTMARKGENTRMREDVDKFNERLTLCAYVFGINLSLVPFLRMYDFAKKGDDKKFGQACRREALEEIPIYVLMGNSKGAAKAKDLMENHVSKNVGRDQEDVINDAGYMTNRGRALVQLVVDEADCFVQPGTMLKGVHVPGALEAALNSRVGLSTESEVAGDIHITTTMKPSLFDAFTSVLLVTATIYAFLGTEEPFVVRSKKDVIFATPSSNYWSLMKMEGWRCKLIQNRVVCSHAPMLDDMIEDSTGPRHGLVANTSNSGTRSKKFQDDHALNAAKNFPDIISMVWNGDGVKIYTPSLVWKSIFGGTGAFDRTVASDAVDASDDRSVIECFTSKKENNNKTEWNSSLGEKGGVNRADIHSYRGVIDLIYECSRHGVRVPHTMLFSLNMAARGTPIKVCCCLLKFRA